MPRRLYKTPGVFVKEIGRPPRSIEALPTAVPAFIGYTPRCQSGGKSFLNIPTKISSLDAFVRIYGRAHAPDGEGSPEQKPNFHLAPTTAHATADTIDINGTQYSLYHDASTLYHLYDSLRLFFLNGGAEAYVVSTGAYGKPRREPATDPRSTANPNVRLPELLAGLAALEPETEPTLYLCPDATLLPPSENATLVRSMLQQNAKTRTAVSLLDLSEGRAPSPSTYLSDIAAFRSRVGSQHLSFGIAYYPFLESDVVQPEEIDPRNLFGGDPEHLEPLLSPVHQPNRDAAKLLRLIVRSDGDASLRRQYEQKLERASDTYRRLKRAVRKAANRLPPSGALAGLISKTDRERGVWKAPANVAIQSVSAVTLALSSAQQAPLNHDPHAGKSINAIRDFSGRGILVWGARTLAGNDPELRFIPARRTLLFLENSIRRSLQAFVFEPNDATTWSSIQQTTEAFLNGLWRSGAFAGSTERHAYNVRCGLGSTMSRADLNAKRIKVQVAVALVRPAAFSIVTLTLRLHS